MLTIRSRSTALGPLLVRRALPVREKRMIGPWCFLDRYGPVTFSDEKAMDVAPHPHIGLQTVSWLLDGEVLHRDSLGCEATVVAGGVNVMTAGRGIAHAEETPERNRERLDGVQLWIALPEDDRKREPSFEHVPEVPQVELRGGIVRPFIGSFGRVASPAIAFSDILGADIELHRGETMVLPLHDAREHGLYVLNGSAQLEGELLAENTLYYFERGRAEAALTSSGGARLLLIGGLPFPERIAMWWNFVARTGEELAAARMEWESGERFGIVRGYEGPRIEAPPMHRVAPANPAS